MTSRVTGEAHDAWEVPLLMGQALLNLFYSLRHPLDWDQNFDIYMNINGLIIN